MARLTAGAVDPGNSAVLPLAGLDVARAAGSHSRVLANPIAFPLYADPLVWAIAFVAMFAEVFVAHAVLRRAGLRDPHFAGPLLAVSLCTWIPFLVAVHELGLADDASSVPALIALEVGVVVVEAPLIHLACRGRFFSRRTEWRPVSWGRATWASVAGNATSVAVSVLVPFAVFSMAS